MYTGRSVSEYTCSNVYNKNLEESKWSSLGEWLNCNVFILECLY